MLADFRVMHANYSGKDESSGIIIVSGSEVDDQPVPCDCSIIDGVLYMGGRRVGSTEDSD